MEGNMNQELYEFKQYIRKFPTYNLLEVFFDESTDIYKNYNNGTRLDTVPIYNKKTGYKIGEYPFYISQWDLLEVCFYSIKYGNDYRFNKIDKNELYTILNKNRHISEKLENVSAFEDKDLYKHLICITNMEFDFETLNIQSKFNRLYHIITIINSNSNYDQTSKVCYIDLKKKFYEITKIDYHKYIKCYMLITILATTRKDSNFMSIVKDIQFDVEKLGFTKKDIEKIISIQSKEYSFYKDFDNWNILKYNPIVHSQKYQDKYIITNIPALLISFSEFIYWTIRNYYNSIESRDFTTYFGHCFEYYLNDFFIEYNINAEKIDEDNDKKPDWKIETNNYIFLIEQKAGLYPMDTRSITSNNRFDALNSYLKNNIEKAFIQLNNYKIKSNKIIIRICLTFEQIYMTELVKEIVLSTISNITDQHLNWIVPINEFEKLFIILSEDEDKFNSIIEEKIRLEKNLDKNGRGFDKLLDTYKNKYTNEKIDYFHQILNEELEILKDL